MKLLFDENLSPQLVRLLSDLFPDSVHVRDVGLETADDAVVWKIRSGQLANHLLEGLGHASTQFCLGLSSESCVGPIGKLLNH
jgi:hypothetical protein